MPYRHRTNAAWSHKTKRFRVVLEILPEDSNPRDHFEFQEDVDAVIDGEVEWFCARVTVYGPQGEELGFDSLGACAYRTIREFYTSHRDPDPMNRNCSLMRKAHGNNVVICHYFPDMVRQAVSEARRTISSRKQEYRNIHA